MHDRADLPAPSAAALALISPIRRCKTTKLRSNESKTSTQNMKQIDPTPQNFSARTRRSLALRRPMKQFLTNQLVPSRALCCPILAAIVSLTILSASQTNAAGVFSYSLTTQNDPVSPGHVLEYDATVTNLRSDEQRVGQDFTARRYTTYGG